MNKCLKILSFLILLIGISVIVEPYLYNLNSVPYSDIPSLYKIPPIDLTFNDYVSIMTYNLRNKTLDNGKQSWNNRKEKIILNIKKYMPDIFSVQEDSKEQIEYIEEALLPEYNYLGLMIKEKYNGNDYEAPINVQHNSIFFNRNKFRPLFSKNIHLNEKEIPFEKGWDAYDPRTATIALLEHKKKPRERIILINAHLDHMGREARKESIKTIFRAVSIEFHGRNYPMFMMGDFNESPKQSVDEMILQKGFVDVYSKCQSKSKTKECYFGDFHPVSFHNYFGKWADNIFVRGIFYLLVSVYNKKMTEINRVHIDHMYYKDGDKIKVNMMYFAMPSQDLINNKDGVYASDHFPLFSLFKLEKAS